MEVGVRVLAQNPITGEERHTNSCFVTFVAVDEDGRPVRIAQVLPETEDEKRRFEAGRVRRGRVAVGFWRLLSIEPATGGHCLLDALPASGQRIPQHTVYTITLAIRQLNGLVAWANASVLRRMTLG